MRPRAAGPRLRSPRRRRGARHRRRDHPVDLARATAAAKASATVPGEAAPPTSAAQVIAFSALRWGDAATVEALGDGPGGGTGSFDLVLGTELMYYATPVDALVATIAAALRRPLETPLASPQNAPPACALLSHFFRRAELPQELVAACNAHGEKMPYSTKAFDSTCSVGLLYLCPCLTSSRRGFELFCMCFFL